MTTPPSAGLPFSRPFDVGQIGDRALGVTIAAEPGELQALARADRLVALSRLVATFDLAREGPTGVHVTGVVKADVRQTCVLTLENFDTAIVQPVDVHFQPAAARADQSAAARAAEADDGSFPDDEPDVIVNGQIDLGALAAEFLALALDPYPRKPGAVFVEPAPPETGEDSPFAVLGRFKAPRSSES